MGKIKYLAEVRKFFEKTPVASSRDIKLFLKNKSFLHFLQRFHLVLMLLKMGF